MAAQTIKIGGRRMVLLDEADYVRLRSKAARSRGAEDHLPPPPPRNRSGRHPAAAYLLASIARELVRDRIAAGLSQEQLARRARIRPQTLARIESGKHVPTIQTLRKLDRALGKSMTG